MLAFFYSIFVDGNPPTIECISCERLFSSKNITHISELRKNYIIPKLLDMELDPKIDYVKKLLDHCAQENVTETAICKTCCTALKNYKLPSMCILNNLSVSELPPELCNLNNYEKMLIQRMKSFQTVIKMDTVMKKHVPNKVKIDKVVGRTFYLMLPLEETLKKICPDTDPLNCDQNLFILVRSSPTKNKIIWEDLVNIKKVWEALVCLKKINHFYSHEELSQSLKSQQLQYEIMQEKIDVKKNEETDDISEKISDYSKYLPKGALLTRKDETDPFYKQFTIYPLHGEKINDLDSNLYQMLYVYGLFYQLMPISSKNLYYFKSNAHFSNFHSRYEIQKEIKKFLRN